MVSNTLFHIVLSTIERKENIEALHESGLPTTWTGKNEWASIEIHDHEQWHNTLDLLLEAVDKENNTVIDPYLTKLLSLNLAFA
jgi:hypothetical protein